VVGASPAFERASGILLHPTSLPGPYGIGDLGPAAHAWVDQLVRAGQKWWQVLPLGPTGYGDSPYQSLSALAGNPLLISPECLVEDGLLDRADLAGTDFPPDSVDFGRVIPWKNQLLDRAWTNYQAGRGTGLWADHDVFCTAQGHWLEEFCLFLALKDRHGGASWLTWPMPIRRREPAALRDARQSLAAAADRHRFVQFLFFRQWAQVRSHANQRGLKLIGDVPIFVSSDSADVWAHPELFQLDDACQPRVVSGVPTDYFSATGQLWGNPLYDWPTLKRSSYRWWLDRLRAILGQVDLIRLDHFRGFEAYWEVPAGETTAMHGRWVPGPGADFFEAALRHLGQLPLIAEDLGVITPAVEALRRRFHWPGMRILQFAFGGAVETRFLPHNFEPHTVVYTGTHDNDTTRGWYAGITPEERRYFLRYTGRDGSDPTWDLIRLAWASVADLALSPLQDVLDLGSPSRMNRPGRPDGNWRWRYRTEMLGERALDRLAELTAIYGRN